MSWYYGGGIDHYQPQSFSKDLTTAEAERIFGKNWHKKRAFNANFELFVSNIGLVLVDIGLFAISAIFVGLICGF